jgi:hypothetical protein
MGHRILCVVVACLLLVGCAGSPIYLANASEEQLQEASNGQLYFAFNYFGHDSPKIEAELRRRNLFTNEQWSRIKLRKISIGDTKDVVLASWGEPLRYYKDIGRWGTTEQLVYSGQYVYIENGVVDAISTR